MSSTSHEAIAQRLTAAIADGNVDELGRLYAENAIIWHSSDEVELTLEQLKDIVRAIDQVATATVDVTARHPLADGFLQTQINTYSLKSGDTIRFHAALVVKLNHEGLIVRADEYLDGNRLAPLLQALEPK